MTYNSALEIASAILLTIFLSFALLVSLMVATQEDSGAAALAVIVSAAGTVGSLAWAIMVIAS